MQTTSSSSALIASLHLARITGADLLAAIAIGVASAGLGWLVSLAVQS